jgi:putative methyltransferase (TIGR04325 family)
VGFDDDTWAEETRRYTERVREACARASPLPLVADDNALLAILMALVSGAGRLPVRVLDFGGGMGISYVLTAASMGRSRSIEYHVVENRKICEEGAKLFEGDGQIHFHSELPDALPGLDVLYINSVLQYVEDYAGLLRTLCALSPRFILFARCSVGQMPTYASAQLNHPGKRIPYWFINVEELASILAEFGYLPIFMARGSYSIIQSNFEPEYQIGSASNLLFTKVPKP